jgi:hypothetical protein
MVYYAVFIELPDHQEDGDTSNHIVESLQESDFEVIQVVRSTTPPPFYGTVVFNRDVI